MSNQTSQMEFFFKNGIFPFILYTYTNIIHTHTHTHTHMDYIWLESIRNHHYNLFDFCTSISSFLQVT